MPRYSLSPIPTYGSKFNYDDSDGDYDDDDDSEQTEILIRNDECVTHPNDDDYIDEEDDDDDDEEDYPHPIGFGKTRFGFYERTTDTVDTSSDTSSNEIISMNTMNSNSNSNSNTGFMSRYHLNVPRYQCQLQNAKQKWQ